MPKDPVRPSSQQDQEAQGEPQPAPSGPLDRTDAGAGRGGRGGKGGGAGRLRRPRQSGQSQLFITPQSTGSGSGADAAFAAAFFAIWLSPKTSEPKLRQALLGSGA